MTSTARTSNLGLDLAGKFAAVSGGTHGMGEAIALRFARAGASVIIIGRNEAAANGILEQCRLSQRPGSSYHFVKADLTLVSGIKQAVRDIEAKAPNGVDYLVETQGGPPISKYAETSEGHEAHFALQCLSRFGLPYLLLRDGKLNESLAIIAAAGKGGAKLDLDDLELKKGGFTIINRGMRDSNVIDGFLQVFQRQHPKLRCTHVFPGIVATEQRIFPMGVNWAYNNLVRPIVPYTVGFSPEYWGENAVYLAANPAYRPPTPGQPGLFQQALKVVAPSGFAKDEGNCRAIYDRLVAMMDG